MDTFDGRGLALGIAVGVVVGLGIWLMSGNVLWIGLMAAVGAVFGMNVGKSKQD